MHLREISLTARKSLIESLRDIFVLLERLALDNLTPGLDDGRLPETKPTTRLNPEGA